MRMIKKLMPKRFSYSVSPALVECSNHQAEYCGQVFHKGSVAEVLWNGISALKLPVIVWFSNDRVQIKTHSMTHLNIFNVTFLRFHQNTLYQLRNRVFYDGIYAEYPWITNIHTHIDASSDWSDEHIPWVWFWCCIHFLNELYNCFSHQIWFINFMFCTNGGHIFFDGVRHS